MQLNTLHSHLPPTVSTVKSERANARNVSLLTFHGGQFIFSTQLLTPNYIRTQFWLGRGGGVLKLRIALQLESIVESIVTIMMESSKGAQ